MALSKSLSEEQKDMTLDWLESNVLNHPEYGREVKKTLKKIDARIQFPEIDAEDRFEAKAKEQEEKVNKFLEEQRTKENKQYWEGQRKTAIEAGYLKDEEEARELEKWMVDEHIGNYQKAAKLFHDERHAAAEPTNYADVTGLTLPADEGLFSNPIKWSRDTAYKTINEIRRSR